MCASGLSHGQRGVACTRGSVSRVTGGARVFCVSTDTSDSLKHETSQKLPVTPPKSWRLPRRPSLTSGVCSFLVSPVWHVCVVHHGNGHNRAAAAANISLSSGFQQKDEDEQPLVLRRRRMDEWTNGRDPGLGEGQLLSSREDNEERKLRR